MTARACIASSNAPDQPAFPLMLIHGAGGSSRHWELMLQHLPSPIAPVVVDLPGHGSSDVEAYDLLHQSIEAIEALMIREAPGRCWTLVGHSLGGLLALKVALDRRVPVMGLGLLNTAAMIAVNPRVVRMLTSTLDTDDEQLIHQGFASETGETVVKLVTDDLHRSRLRPNSFDAIEAMDLRADVTNLAIPVVVIWARHDPVISARKSRTMAAAISQAKAVETDGGHYSHLERPAVVAAEVTDLMARSKTQTMGLRAALSQRSDR